MDDAAGSVVVVGAAAAARAFCPSRAHARGQRTASHQSMDLQGVVEAGAFFIDSVTVTRLWSLC